MQYNKTFVIDFAIFVQSSQGDAEELFDAYLDKYQNPHPEVPDNIYYDVTNSACDMCGVTIDELKSGRKYGEIASCKQMITQILFELKCPVEDIMHNLPFMGNENSIKSRLYGCSKNEFGNKNFRIVINQLREKFGVLIKH